uniref:Minor capsid protein P8 central region domain-containing protein n=1 Tax=viral metagenome TaxID=1070528 RepID=A0A6C0F3W2_9ZZZZ
MSRNSRFNNFDKFQPVEQMNPTVRAQQYAFNGRIFIPPQTDKFIVDEKIVGDNNVLNAEYQYRNQGGLIQMEKNEISRPYDLYSDSNKQQDTDVKLISNIVVPNALSRTYFSNDNVERIQTQIVNEVYRQSQKSISKQSYQELQIIMKSMYLQYSRNLPTDIESQVKVLNKYVIDECVRIIIPNVTQYNKYIEDITSPIPIMPRSQNVSIKGSKYGDFSSLIPSTMNTM